MKIIKTILKTIIKTILSLILIVGVCIGYVTFGERNLLTVRNNTLDAANNSGQAIKIVQFSDSHLGEFYTYKNLERAVKKINEQKPDIVVFTGDLFDIASQLDDPEKSIAILNNISATLGKFAVFGNRDYGGGAGGLYKAFMEKSGFTVLRDESVRIEGEGRSIAIFGADDYVLGYPNVEILMGGIDENDLNIFIVHEPDAIKNYTQYPIDVAFAGHSHGGQVTLPFYGAIIKTNMCETYFKGLYKIANNRQTQFFVSSGLGNTKLPFRLGNVPEIVTFSVNY